jgi:hypothetical protein
MTRDENATATRTAGSIPLAMCHIRDGDVITLPGETEQRTVDSAWWIMRETSHGFRFADGEQRTYKRDGAPDVTLHERPGFGPFDAVYQIGDRVSVYFSGGEDVGEVTDVIRFGDDVVYEVHTVLGGAGAAVGPENMRREITPEVGQQWVTPANGRTFTVAGFDSDFWPGRLVVQGERLGHRVALGGPKWALIVSGPHAASPSVRRCDVGGEQLDGAWWLLRSVARGWEADHGAACATHAGQHEPDPGTVFQPRPTGYGAAVEAQMERAGLRVDLVELLSDEAPAVDMPTAPTAAALADTIAANQPPQPSEPRMYGARDMVWAPPGAFQSGWADLIIAAT